MLRRFGIRPQYGLSSGERAHQHQQRRARQMKVRQQGVHKSPLVSRTNESVGEPREPDWFIVAPHGPQRFKRPRHGRSNGNDAPPTTATRRDSFGGGSRHFAPL